MWKRPQKALGWWIWLLAILIHFLPLHGSPAFIASLFTDADVKHSMFSKQRFFAARFVYVYWQYDNDISFRKSVSILLFCQPLIYFLSLKKTHTFLNQSHMTRTARPGTTKCRSPKYLFQAGIEPASRNAAVNHSTTAPTVPPCAYSIFNRD